MTHRHAKKTGNSFPRHQCRLPSLLSWQHREKKEVSTREERMDFASLLFARLLSEIEESKDTSPRAGRGFLGRQTGVDT